MLPLMTNEATADISLPSLPEELCAERQPLQCFNRLNTRLRPPPSRGSSSMLWRFSLGRRFAVEAMALEFLSRTIVAALKTDLKELEFSNEDNQVYRYASDRISGRRHFSSLNVLTMVDLHTYKHPSTLT